MSAKSTRHAVLIVALTWVLAGCQIGRSHQAAGGNSPSPQTSPSASLMSPSPSPSPPTLQSAFTAVRSGVVRFEVATCDEYATGSGFALSPNLVATVAHVVADGQVIRLIQGTVSTAGRVIGTDPGADVALVRTQTPLSGHFFHFARSSPHVGETVGALGYPKGDPLTFSPGAINGLDRKAVIDGIPRHGMVELDAATTHGNSGGPVIRADGTVVGLLDAGPDSEPGRRLAVSSRTAKQLISSWINNPQPVPTQTCDSVLGPDGQKLPPDQFPTTEASQVFATLNIYFSSINGGDFPTALAQLLHPGLLSRFTKAVESSQDSEFTVEDVSRRGDTVVVWLRFTSRQDPGQGPSGRPDETCTNWSLDYTLDQSNGLWLIAGTSAHAGEKSAPCPAESPTPSPS